MSKNNIPSLVCPNCLKEAGDCEEYSAYHNRTRYICPHCGYDGDSVAFQTSYDWHPIHKKKEVDLEDRLEEINQQGLANAHTVDFSEEYENSQKILRKNGAYQYIQRIFAYGFISYLDDNRKEGKMCLSNAECEDIMKAVEAQAWEKLARYCEKYLPKKEPNNKKFHV